jgi:hypothetical protein
MQWFDEYDYDQSRFLTQDRYKTEEEARTALGKLTTDAMRRMLGKAKTLSEAIDEIGKEWNVMLERSEPMTGKGKITNQHTVLCAKCDYWEYLGDASTTGVEAVEIAEDQGWKRVDGVWLCPSCQGNK